MKKSAGLPWVAARRPRPLFRPRKMDPKDLSGGVWLVSTRDHDCERYLDRSPFGVERGSLWQVTESR